MIGENSQNGGRQVFNREHNFSNDENVLKFLDYLPGIGCSQGESATPVSLAESRAPRSFGASAFAGPVDRLLKSDHKKVDGECVATHTMEIQSYLVKKKPN